MMLAFKESASIGAMEESSRKGQVLGFMVACAHLVARRVRVDVAVVELHSAAVDGEAAALPGGMALAFGRFKESASFGAMGETSGKWQVLGFSSACSGFKGGRAHIKEGRVRVDVAAGELHVVADDE
jgi:hypothetical protein